MSQNLIELLNSAGTLTVCYEVDSVDQVAKLYDNLLLIITDKGLIEYNREYLDQINSIDKYRFICAKDLTQKKMLLKVQPIRFYLRDHQMNSKIVQVNPYQSIRWLKSLIEKERNVNVKLIVNERQLTQENDSLIHYLYQNCILHVLQCRKDQSKLSILYTKQPGSQSKIFKIQNIKTQSSIDWLAQQISSVTGVPYEFLFLVYSGRILLKDRAIADYNLLNNSFVYAVDSRKYMKQVSSVQYQNRMAETKKFKDNNKYLQQRIKQQSSKKKLQSSPAVKPTQNAMFQKSGDIMKVLDDDIEYFKDPKMNIESQQFKQFQQRGNRVEQRASMEQESENYRQQPQPIQPVRNFETDGVNTPPNSPIYIFNRLDSQNSNQPFQPTLHRVNSELKQGRVVTTETQVFEDPYGFIHEHSKQKILYKNGKTKIVQVDVAEDQEGNIVKIQTDTINIKRDSTTGNTVKVQTQVIEDSDKKRTYINKKEVIDRDGNVISSQTDVFKTGEGSKIQRDVIQDGDKRVQINTEILQDKSGDPYKIQTDVCQTKQDASGNVVSHSKDIKQQNGVTQVTQKSTVRDKQGNIIENKTDVIKITEDDYGNIYKHETKCTDTQNKKIIIERDIVTDKHGQVLSKQTNMKIIREDSNQNLIINQTDVVEQEDGNRVIIEKSIVQNSEGEIIKNQSQMFQMLPEGDHKRDAKHFQSHQQVDQSGNIYRYEKNEVIQGNSKKMIYQTDTIKNPQGEIIMKQTNTTVIEQDQNKNQIVRQTQTIEEKQVGGGRIPQGQQEEQDLNIKKRVVIEKQIVTDPSGNVLTAQTNKRVIEKDTNKNTVIHETNTVEDKQKGNAVTTENNVILNPQGIIIHSSARDSQGKVFQHDRSQVVQGGVTKVTQTDLVTDAQGKVVAKQVNTRTYQQDAQNNKIISQKQTIEKGQAERVITEKNYKINSEGVIVNSTEKDEDGNIYKYDRKQEDVDNKLTVIQTAIVISPEGEVIAKQTNTTIIQQDENRNLIMHERDVVQKKSADNQASTVGDKIIVIQKQSMTSPEGSLLARQTSTTVTQKDANKNKVTHETDVIEQIQYKQNEQGVLEPVEHGISKTSIIQKQIITNAEGEILVNETNIKVIEKDPKNNTVVFQNNVVDTKNSDKKFEVENNTVYNQRGVVIKQKGKDQEGNIYQYERNEGSNENKKVIVQTDVVKTSEGQILSKQINTKVFEATPENNIIIRNISEVGDGQRVKLIETDTLIDPYGNLIGKDTTSYSVYQGQNKHTFIREKDNLQPQYGEGRQTEKFTELDSQGVVVRTVQRDASGNIIEYQRKEGEKQNKTIVTVTETVRDQDGRLIQKQINTKIIEQDQQNNILTKQIEVIEQKNNDDPHLKNKVIIQTQTVQDSQGKIIARQTNQKLIEKDANKNTFIKQTDIIEQIKYKDDQGRDSVNKKSIIQKQIVKDPKGQIIINETNIRVIEKDGDKNIVIFQTNQIDQKNADLKLTSQNETTLDKQGNVVKSQGKDEEGNLYMYKKQQKSEDNKKIIIETDTVANAKGQLLSKQTNKTEIQTGQNMSTIVRVTDVIQQGDQSKVGATKIIIQKQIMRDESGNVIGKQTNTTTIEQDPTTKNIITHETNVIEEAEKGSESANVKSIIEKQTITNPQGEMISNETNIKVVELDQNQNTFIFQNKVIDSKNAGKKIQVQRNTVVNSQGVVIKSQDKDEDGTVYEFERSQVDGKKRKIIVETDVIKDEHGDILAKETNTRIIKLNSQNDGTIIRQTDVVEEGNGNITAVQKIVEYDAQGKIISSYERDQEGNTHQYEKEQKEVRNREGQKTKVVVEKQLVTDAQGDVIKQETTTKTTFKDRDKNTHVHEINLIQQKDVAVEIQNQLVLGPYGEILKSDCQVHELGDQVLYQPKQIQLSHQRPEAVFVGDQRQPLINAGKEVTIDQLGNTHIHQKQLIEKQGKTTFVNRDTIEDPRGKLIRIETDIVQIEGDDQGNMHKHKSEIIQQEGRVTMVQTDELRNPDGVIVRKQKDTIQIEGGEDGSVFKHQTDVIEQEGKKKIIERNIIQDQSGNVIKSTTKITQVEDNQDATEVHQKQQVIEAVEGGEEGDQEVSKDIQVIQDENGNVVRRQTQVKQGEDGQKTIIQRCSVQNSQGQVVRQQTQLVRITQKEGSNEPEVHRHFVDYEQAQNKVIILQSTSKQNADGSIIRSEKQTLQIEQCQDGTIKKRQLDVVEEGGRKIVHVRNTVEDQTGRILSKTSDVVELQSGDIAPQIQYPDRDQQINNENSIERVTNVDKQGNIHIVETEIKNQDGHEIQIQRQFVSDAEGKLLKTETGILDIEKREDGVTKMTAVDIIQSGNVVTVTQNDSLQSADGTEIRSESGTMVIKDLGAGIKKKQRQNIIQQGGIKLRIQKQTYEDQEGNIIQQKVNTTQLVSHYDEDGNKQLSGQGFKRKQQKMHQDSQGNTHFYERQIVDDQDGKSTVIQTEVVRNNQNQLLTATTDVIEMEEQGDGTVLRHEVNIIEKPGKVTVAETNSLENADGQRIKGQVQSLVVTQGQDGQTIKKQTGIIMQNLQKTIVQKIIVEDQFGNFIKTETKKKRIYTDQNGVERGRDMETHQVDEIQIRGQPSTIQKQVFVDISGVVHATQRLTTYKEEGDKQITETTTVKVKQLADGSFVDEEMNVTKVIKNQDGQIQIITTPVQIPLQEQLKYTQVNSQIRGPQKDNEEVQREMMEDAQGNLHTFQKQIVQKGDTRTVKKSQIVQNSSGQIIKINTNVEDTEELQDGKVVKHTTEIVSGDKVITTQTVTIQNPDGSILSQKTKKIEVTEDEGLIKTYTTNITKQDGRITVDKTETLEDEEGNILDSSSNKLQIKETQQAIREQARQIAQAEVLGQVTGVVTQYNKDSKGLTHVTERQTIDDHGKKIVVDSLKIQDAEGNVIKAQTDITSQLKLENGKVAKKTAVISQQGDKVCVIQYTQVKQDDSNLQKLQQQHQMQMSRSSKGQNLNDLLGLNQSVEGGSQIRAQDKITVQSNYEDLLGNSGEVNRSSKEGELLLQSNQFNRQQQNQNFYDLLGSSGKSLGSIKEQSSQIRKGHKIQQSDNLLQSSYEAKQPGYIYEPSSQANYDLLGQNIVQGDSSKKITQLPIFSKKQLQTKQVKRKESIPKQYQIILVDDSGKRTRINARYDWIIDQLAQELAGLIGVEKGHLKFDRDGQQFEQYEMIADLQIMPNDEIHYTSQ